MAMLVFAALAVTAVAAIVWGTAAVALRQFQQEKLTMGAATLEPDGPIAETSASTGWSITPSHLRMW